MAPVAEFPEPAETIKMPRGETIKLPGEAIPLESADPEWVDTPSARQVLRVLEYARKYGDIAVVHEGTGVDKTESARRYKGLCKNVWIAVMLPAEERLLPCVRQVARAYGTEYWGRDTAYLYHGLSRALGGKRGLLIIDEAQHLGHSPLEALRGLHDETGCALALLGNDDFRRRIRRPEFTQLVSRVGARRHLPRATPDDVDAILDAWGIEGAKVREQGHRRATPPAGLRSLVRALERGRIAGVKALGSRRGRTAQGGAT